jgi:cardiolipin synthase
MGQLGQILDHGCRVWFAPPPFDHTKMMIVDRAWVLLGSSNWDPRSLRLNFEFDVECYDPALAADLDDRVAETISKSRGVTAAAVNGRSLRVKLRDGAARLLTPYL